MFTAYVPATFPAYLIMWLCTRLSVWDLLISVPDTATASSASSSQLKETQSAARPQGFSSFVSMVLSGHYPLINLVHADSDLGRCRLSTAAASARVWWCSGAAVCCSRTRATPRRKAGFWLLDSIPRHSGCSSTTQALVCCRYVPQASNPAGRNHLWSVCGLVGSVKDPFYTFGLPGGNQFHIGDTSTFPPLTHFVFAEVYF